MNCESKVSTGVVTFGYKLSVCMKVPILGIPYKWDNTFAFFMIGSFHLVNFFHTLVCTSISIFLSLIQSHSLSALHFVHPPFWWALGSFRLLTIVNNMAVNMSCQYPRLCLQCFGGLRSRL